MSIVSLGKITFITTLNWSSRRSLSDRMLHWTFNQRCINARRCSFLSITSIISIISDFALKSPCDYIDESSSFVDGKHWLRDRGSIRGISLISLLRYISCAGHSSLVIPSSSSRYTTCALIVTWTSTRSGSRGSNVEDATYIIFARTRSKVGLLIGFPSSINHWWHGKPLIADYVRCLQTR